ncbi:hypothetical protein BHE74_00015382 [Ensete ventricosum]|nr:hypothetical protein BHE74_00015382 [Ensete ventricosum]
MEATNSALQAENKELKVGASQEAVAATKKRATELSAKVDRLKATLEKSEQCSKDLKLVVDSAHVELRDLRDSQCWLEDEVLSLTKEAEMLQSELKAKGDQAIADYKKSQGF